MDTQWPNIAEAESSKFCYTIYIMRNKSIINRYANIINFIELTNFN